MIWFNIIEVRLGLTWFAYVVVRCLLVLFGVILHFIVLMDVFWRGSGVIGFD